VPLAQIVTGGNVQIPDVYNGGLGQFLSIGQVPYDLSGAKAGTDTPLFLNFTTNSIGGAIPEPGTFILAGMGALGLLLAWRRRK
jgi:MYXO-CTERM domain-containing protein